VVVIATAYDEHALEAFETGAIDYLLKPVSQARLQRAVERAWSLRTKPLQKANAVAAIASAATPANSAANRKIVGRIGSEYLLLDPDEILCFQAEGELVWIVTGKQRLLGSQTLRMIEERLKERQFQRVHRNTVVNVNHVRKMSAMSSQSLAAYAQQFFANRGEQAAGE
jgi:DNA-binding LytR/AlgR family response regulator